MNYNLKFLGADVQLPGQGLGIAQSALVNLNFKIRRKRDTKTRSFSKCAFYNDRPFMLIHDPLGKREAQSRAGMLLMLRLLSAIEAFKDAGQIVFVNADAAILDRERHCTGLGVFDAKSDPSS